MKNEKLKQYIRDNKQLFEEEPEKGHFERFRQKAVKTNHKIILLRWSKAVAATVALFILAGTIWQYNKHQVDNKHQVVQKTIDCKDSNNMKLCYLNKMNDVAGQINILTKEFDEWDRQQVMDDVQNVIDATQVDIRTDIPEELPEETAQSILLEYYQHNLNCLLSIEKVLEDKNQSI